MRMKWDYYSFKCGGSNELQETKSIDLDPHGNILHPSGAAYFNHVEACCRRAIKNPDFVTEDGISVRCEHIPASNGPYAHLLPAEDRWTAVYGLEPEFRRIGACRDRAIEYVRCRCRGLSCEAAAEAVKNMVIIPSRHVLQS